MPKRSTPQSLFGRRLREARLRHGIAQDKLGVAVGLDEGSSSARISRYETGTHEPPFSMAEKLSDVLCVPVAYFYCADDALAELLDAYAKLDSEARTTILVFARSLLSSGADQGVNISGGKA